MVSSSSVFIHVSVLSLPSNQSLLPSLTGTRVSLRAYSVFDRPTTRHKHSLTHSCCVLLTLNLPSYSIDRPTRECVCVCLATWYDWLERGKSRLASLQNTKCPRRHISQLCHYFSIQRHSSHDKWSETGESNLRSPEVHLTKHSSCWQVTKNVKGLYDYSQLEII